MKSLYQLMGEFVKIMELGAMPPVDVFPFLKWIPERWLGNWVTRASNVGRQMDSVYHGLADMAIKRREQQGGGQSIIDRILDRQEAEKLRFTRHQLDFLGGVAMEGGSETTAATVLSVIKALTCHPDVQRKAHAEIDEWCTEDASPRWSDRERLPYVLQIIKETMRWRPIGGLDVPHSLSEGMFLSRWSLL